MGKVVNFTCDDFREMKDNLVEWEDDGKCANKCKSNRSIFEATIAELQQALSSGSIASVELTVKYLLRIFTYDCRGPCLNSIPILNPGALDEAAASDARRRDGRPLGPLEGIPYTLKDSMKYKGMTCAAGSPAFQDLVANEDCFVAEQLRKAGAVCLGLTNTPPMMASGMHRGVYGRAESPYNLEYLTAAFSSGSSNGSGTSTAASFAAFGLGSETVSSGRSPASNNALIAYTPSRGVISPRGIWPLYSTCDVVVPHTRTMQDMATILDVLTQEDPRNDGDFWRQQKFVDVPRVTRPRSHLDLLSNAQNVFDGKRVAVPKMFVGGNDPMAKPTIVSKDVIKLWDRARADLESMGAVVVETDFPLVTKYEDDSVSGETNNVVGFKPDWNGKERGELVAYLWDDFLKSGGDSKFSAGLGAVEGANIFPRPAKYIPDRYMEHKNFMNYPGLVELARNRGGKSIWDIDGIAEALPALEAQRKRDFEDWLEKYKIDVVVFPANGDVGKADLETNDESARHALRNGVKYSNGNRAIRHMGVPTVSVPIGIMDASSMPLNLTFAGNHGQDSELLEYACVFEKHTLRRVPPPIAPSLSSDSINVPITKLQPTENQHQLRMALLSAKRSGASSVQVICDVETAPESQVFIEAYVDGKLIPKAAVTLVGGRCTIETEFAQFTPTKPLYGGVGLVVGNVNIIVLARSGALVAAKLVSIAQDT